MFLLIIIKNRIKVNRIEIHLEIQWNFGRVNIGQLDVRRRFQFQLRCVARVSEHGVRHANGSHPHSRSRSRSRSRSAAPAAAAAPAVQIESQQRRRTRRRRTRRRCHRHRVRNVLVASVRWRAVTGVQFIKQRRIHGHRRQTWRSGNHPINSFPPFFFFFFYEQFH